MQRSKTGALTFRKQNKSHLKAHTNAQYALGHLSLEVLHCSPGQTTGHISIGSVGTRTNRYRNRCSYFFSPRCRPSAVTITITRLALQASRYNILTVLGPLYRIILNYIILCKYIIHKYYKYVNLM